MQPLMQLQWQMEGWPEPAAPATWLWISGIFISPLNHFLYHCFDYSSSSMNSVYMLLAVI